MKNSTLFYMIGIICLFTSNGISQNTIQLQPLSQIFKPQLLKKDSTSNKNPFAYSLAKFEVSELPIFCKNEYKWSKLSGVNVRMRLGSLDYVNMLENK